MAIEFHSDAAVSFNTRGNSLLARIRPRLTKVGDSKGFSPDLHIAANLTESDIIGEMRVTLVDPAGTELARYFREGSVEVGLEGEDYQQFARLIESIQRTATCKPYISQKRLTEVAFDWFRDARKLTTKSTLADYISEVCNVEIRDYEVAIPIALLSVETTLLVGRAIIRPITKSMLDQWFQPIRDRHQSDDERRNREDDLNRKRIKLQGYSAAFVKVRAERIRAEEIALEEAEAAIGLLRYFAGASLSSRLACFCAPLGKENIQQFQAIFFLDGLLESWTQQVVQKDCRTWALSTTEIEQIRKNALDALSEIYRNPTTELHRRIIDAVLLFSRVSISNELSDKLVLLLASLESLFLRNETEPIQQNLGDRLALITGTDLAERKDIVSITKHVYGLRSRFLHHAQAIDDVALMDRFMVYAWRGILIMISNRNLFATLDKLLERIDERKLA